MLVGVDHESSPGCLPVSFRDESPQASIQPMSAAIYRTLATLMHRYSLHLVLASFTFPTGTCQCIPAVLLIERM